jgi:hypothetical protein
MDRGMTAYAGGLYKVTDQTLYVVDSAGVQSAVGTIEGTARCSFATDGAVLVIVSEGRVYEYNGIFVVESTDVDFESPDYVAYLNNQAIYDGFGNRFAVSEPGELTNIDGLSYASAESDGDALILPYVLNQLLYLYGTKTIETWYNSGVGDPPFDRVQGGIIQVGTASGNSVANNDQFMYFLGDDLEVNRVISSQSQVVSTIPLVNEFQSYGTVDDSIGFCFSMQNQEFYFLTFPTEGKTWVYNETSGVWFQMTSGVSEGAHIATSYVYHYGKHLIADGGDVHEWDFDTLTDNGAPIIRERATGNMAAELLGPQLAGLPVTWNSIDFIFASTNPADISAVLMYSYSDDGGYTYSTERHLPLARSGKYIWKVQASQLGTSVERVHKMRLSDPVHLTIQRAAADVEVGFG